MANKLRATSAVVLLLLVLFAFLSGQSVAGRPYDDDNKEVEDTVREVVGKAIKKDRGIAAALIRLVFHDCWVNGCDGSVLLDRTPTDGTNTEKKAKNNIGLDGFDVIDEIKKKLHDVDVSCADILVLAGRDAAVILSDGKISYEVARGRLDGVTSSAAEADRALPTSEFDFQQLKTNFGGRQFTVEELVVLSGAHSVGVAHLSSYATRLNASATPDFQIDSRYRAALTAATPPALLERGQDPTVFNNARDETAEFQRQANYDPAALGVDPTRKKVLDNSYYRNTLVNKVLFKSDWVLRTDDEAAGKLLEYRNKPEEWNKDFSDAMAKLSRLPAQGKNLEVRRNCRVPNNYY